MVASENHDEVSLDWEAWRSLRDEAARDRVIRHYLPFARMMAAKLFAARTYPELEFGDYLQYATLGLIESADRFDPGYGVKFETFAARRIEGAVLDGVSKLGELQQQVSARKRAIAIRVESIKEGEENDASSADIFNRLADIAMGLALGFALEGSGMFQRETHAELEDNTYHGIELRQLREQLNVSIDILPQTERRVIRLHYLQEHSFMEIAAMLRLSKGRIAQIHKQALRRMQENLAARRAVDLQY